MSSDEVADGDFGWHRHWIAKKGKKIQIFTLVMEVDAGISMGRSKTVGTIMCKNNNKVLMVAHSGYSTSQGREEGCLDTAKWNALALNHVSKQMNFRFPGNIRDNAGPILEEHRGRAHAGHVEILLACWYVVDVFARHIGSSDMPEEEAIRQLKRLRNINLGDERTAFITIDSEPCRPCLQFLNKLSRHTGILFLTSGSQGVGPVQVRLDGQRRCDVVGEIFPDSDSDEEPAIEPLDGGASLLNQKKQSGPSATAAYYRLNERRICKQPVRPWFPENPEELVSSYKKKTPVYEFPGYRAAPRSNLSIPHHREGTKENQPDFILIDDEEALEPDFIMVDGDAEEALEPRELQETDWEDLGDGLKVERSQGSPPDNLETLSIRNPTLDLESVAGSAYAQTAYEAVEGHKGGLEQIKELGTRNERRNIQARLRSFRHNIDADDSMKESYFKRRYSILRPRC